MDKEKRVLILIPTNEVKTYCAGKFFKQLGKLDLTNADILFSDDTVSGGVAHTGEKIDDVRRDEHMKFIKRIGYEVIKCTKTVDLIDQGVQLRVRDKLCYNRDNLREAFIKREQYTHALWIDSDVLPPVDVVDRLLSNDVDIVGGLYWQVSARISEGKQIPHYEPVAYKFQDKETWEMHKKHLQAKFDNLGEPLNNEELLPSRLIPEDDEDIHITALGTGCLMMSREAMTQPWRFRYTITTPATEDMFLCLDLKRFGYEIYLDTYVKCRHYPRPWEGER